MDNIIKIPAEQANFDTSGTKSLVDIRLPSGMGAVNLKKSYLEVTMKRNSVYAADADAVANDCVYVRTGTPVSLSNSGGGIALVKNCSAMYRRALLTQKQGQRTSCIITTATAGRLCFSNYRHNLPRFAGIWRKWPGAQQCGGRKILSQVEENALGPVCRRPQRTSRVRIGRNRQNPVCLQTDHGGFL